MKLLLPTIIIFGLTFGTLSIKAEESVFTKKYVEIEWAEYPGAAVYELELYFFTSRNKIKTFSSKSNVFKLNVKMGKYLFRSRVIDEDGIGSRWSEMQEIFLEPPPTKITTSPPKLPIEANKKTNRATFDLAWEPLEGVTQYKILAQKESGGEPKEFLSKANSAKLNLPPGDYKFTVAAILADGSQGTSSDPSELFSITGSQLEPPEIKTFKKGQSYKFSISKEKQTDYVEGELLYMPLEGESWSVVEKIENFPKNIYSYGKKFRPGQYKMRLRSGAEGFAYSEYKVIEFLVKPSRLELEEDIPVEVATAFQRPVDGKLPAYVMIGREPKVRNIASESQESPKSEDDNQEEAVPDAISQDGVEKPDSEK